MFVTGRHGLFATYEAFAMVVDSMAMQHAKWLEHCSRIAWRRPIPSLKYLLTSTCWQNDHHGFSHQGPFRNAGELLAKGEEVLAKHRAYVHEHFEDLPEVRDWVWLD
jgi:phosphoketolase